MSIDESNNLGELLQIYKCISKLLEKIETLDVEDIKQELNYILIFPLGEAIFSLFQREDINTLEKNLAEYINHHEKTDPYEFLDFISLYLRRINKNK